MPDVGVQHPCCSVLVLWGGTEVAASASREKRARGQTWHGMALCSPTSGLLTALLAEASLEKESSASENLQA